MYLLLFQYTEKGCPLLKRQKTPHKSCQLSNILTGAGVGGDTQKVTFADYFKIYTDRDKELLDYRNERDDLIRFEFRKYHPGCKAKTQLQFHQ